MKQAVFLLLGCVLGALAAHRWWPTSADTGRALAQPVEPAAHAAEPVPLTLDAPDAAPRAEDQLLARLDAIHLRLDAIEARLAASERRPATVTSPGMEAPELRSLVREVLDERSSLRQAEAERNEAQQMEQAHGKLRFYVRRNVAELGRELDLDAGQKELLTEALIEREERRWSLQSELDPATADPEDWEARFTGVDEDFWARVEHGLGPVLAEELRGHL